MATMVTVTKVAPGFPCQHLKLIDVKVEPWHSKGSTYGATLDCTRAPQLRGAVTSCMAGTSTRAWGDLLATRYQQPLFSKQIDRPWFLLKILTFCSSIPLSKTNRQ